jgi:hypothetical protein
MHRVVGPGHVPFIKIGGIPATVSPYEKIAGVKTQPSTVRVFQELVLAQLSYRGENKVTWFGERERGASS